MSNSIKFTLDGHEVDAKSDETIWQAAQRLGTEIPHLCYAPKPGYRPDGNCRACMVEIDGERTLAASCLRSPTPGMKVSTISGRAEASRKMVMELLLADQPAREIAHDPDSSFWNWADSMNIAASRFPKHDTKAPDLSHSAMAVNLDACINCNLCVRACREVQVNDVIGMSYRNADSKITFDFDDPMGNSTCVACGECVQACPTGALMPATTLDAKGVNIGKPDKAVQSICPYCGVGCQITYQLKDGKILYVEGAEGPSNQNRLCVKGRFGFDYVSHPHRLTKPLIRRADAPKSVDIDMDASAPLKYFREATWEEALEVAANGLKHTRDTLGGKALAGFGSAKCSNEEAYLFQKLIRTGFHTNNVDHCTRLCHASSVAALLETIGSGGVTAPFMEVENADVIIVIGANPTENHPVAATFFKNAVKRGAELIVMDPRGQALKRHASHMVQFRPGSDVSLLNAMMHVIVKEKLYSPNYIEAHTLGFEKLCEHLENYSPEAMAEICRITPATIRKIARDYAKAKAAMIFWGMGVSQHIHGTDNCRCLISLALMCGHVGRPGTGLHPLRGQNNVQGASDAGLIPMMYPDYERVNQPDFKAKFEKLWKVELDPNPGLTVVEIMDAIHAGTIRAMYIMGENPAMSDPDINHARKALSELDHLVVQDLFLTETAFFADVVLPASAWPEKNGTATNTNRQVQMGRKALELPGEALEDWTIIQDIARRMGLDWNYSHPRDVFAEMKLAMSSLDHISWDRLAQENSVIYPCLSDDHPGEAVVFGNGFPSETGRGKFVPAAIIPPDEQPDAEYPFILTTGRQLEHWHTGAMTRRSQVLDDIEPEAVVSLSPLELSRIGAKAGDRLRIQTRRGEIELMARADSAVPEGAIFMAFCYAEAAANKLTNPALDPFGKIPEFKFCAARVEKVKVAAE
jgi:formate dehydrogenase major subunit